MRTEALARVPRPPGATRRPRTSGAAAGSQRYMPSRPTLQPLERRGQLRDDDKHGRGDTVCSALRKAANLAENCEAPRAEGRAEWLRRALRYKHLASSNLQ